LLYRKTGANDAAIASLNRALECDPTMVEAHRNLAELFDLIGRKRDSIKHLSAIHRLIKGD
jgi:tetratricopeptide (TPR) repeat protein